jgi:hypothetical protein
LDLKVPEDMGFFGFPVGTTPLARFVLTQEVGL